MRYNQLVITITHKNPNISTAAGSTPPTLLYLAQGHPTCTGRHNKSMIKSSVIIHVCQKVLVVTVLIDRSSSSWVVLDLSQSLALFCHLGDFVHVKGVPVSVLFFL